MISILVPSRGRPSTLARMIESARKMAVGQIEVIVRIDEGDPSRDKYVRDDVFGTLLIGERCILSSLWNECSLVATGDIQMLAGDDFIFHTPGWDQMVEDAFAQSEDKILLVYGDDGIHGESFASHPIIHRKWIEVCGRAYPPYFSSCYADTWLWDVAGKLGRRKYLPFVNEHMHYSCGKAEKDQTTIEGLERYASDDNARIYASRADEREMDADKLRKMMICQ